MLHRLESTYSTGSHLQKWGALGVSWQQWDMVVCSLYISAVPTSKSAAWGEGLGGQSWTQCGALDPAGVKGLWHRREEMVDPTCLATVPKQESKNVLALHYCKFDFKVQQQ